MGTESPLLDWALYLAAMGWTVFPLAPHAKRPAIKGWETRATTDTDRITRCWGTGTPYNIGIACGPSGLVVLDLDTDTDNGPDGVEALAALCHERGVTLSTTYSVATPSAGKHLYFTSPPGVALRNTTGTLGQRIDTRAGGGYVAAPGSMLPNGGYELLDDGDPPELPAWLVQALLERPTHAVSAPTEIPIQRRSSYVAAALEGECQRVHTAERERHNHTLSRAGYALGQLIGAGLLDHDTAERALTDAAQPLVDGDCDCTPHEVVRVIDAGLAAGARRPRGQSGQEAA